VRVRVRGDGSIDMAIDRLACIGWVAKIQGFTSLCGFETHRAIVVDAIEAMFTATRP
jgi:hypothetical protein